MKKLLSVTLFSGLLTLLRMASGFVIAKVVANYTGPTGIAMLGQIQSLFSALNGIVASPAGNGVVKYTAENQVNGCDECAVWWRAALQWTFLLIAVVMSTTCFFAEPIAFEIFGDGKYFWVVTLTALMLPLSAANTLVGSVINGHHQYRRFVFLGIISIVFATGVMVILVVKMSLDGALISAAIFTGIAGFVMLIGSLRQPWFRVKYWWGRIELKAIKGIGSYVAMSITSAVTIPVSLLIVRNILVERVGWEGAGHWQAVWKISEVYMGVIGVALSTYYFPKVSALKNIDEIFKEIKTTASILIPISLLLAVLVYIFRDIAIELIFTPDFRPARDLFSIQLVGDVFKTISLLYAYPILALRATRFFIGSEIFFSISFVILAQFFVQHFDAQGANIAYAINYFLYLILLAGLIKRIIRNQKLL